MDYITMWVELSDKALETAYVTSYEAHQPTVVSSVPLSFDYSYWQKSCVHFDQIQLLG